MDRLSLLPPNASALEHAGAATAQALTALPVPVRQARDPMQCPVALLPWLAWHHGVDEWDDAWPIDVQRQVIAGNYALMKTRGTRAAVVQALKSIGVPVTYQNAFEYGGNPYCFRLIAQIGQGVWTQGNDELLVRQVNRAKATRSKLDALIIARPLGPGVTLIAGITEMADVIVLQAAPPGPINLPNAQAVMGGVMVMVDQITMAQPISGVVLVTANIAVGGVILMVDTVEMIQ
ncbi:MAG: phage tail protein I [Hyphomicrobiales bacterium]|nr:phage tail protein I [Hyphomicrobiales bacterium]MDE2113823.1 phage tail protein I [Hyphomicrobiales bacterium]